MIIEVVRDTQKRHCAICKKNILKGKTILKYKQVIDGFGNTRMFFAHLDCMIRKLQSIKKDIDIELLRIPKVKHKLSRYEAKK